ncbi:MAG: hypothetical protein J0H19_01235 [Rhodospirillales bacterium]|nr:hypothetical protein [Rhodospirillales bacterium]
MQLSPWRRRYSHAAGLGANGIRRARLIEPLADDLWMHTQKSPEDQPNLVPNGPPFRAGFSEWAIMRRRQTKPDDVLIESALRQTKEKAKRLNALTRRNHSSQQPVE